MRQPIGIAVRAFVLLPWLGACQVTTSASQAPQLPPRDFASASSPAEALSSLATPGESSPPPEAPKDAVVWDCGFPKAADPPAIDQAVASVQVAVGADGMPLWVKIVEDPGYNFGIVAAWCALTKRFVPARDAQGNPMVSITPPIKVRFVR